jgi:hypothetical protein
LGSLGNEKEDYTSDCFCAGTLPFNGAPDAAVFVQL